MNTTTKLATLHQRAQRPHPANAAASPQKSTTHSTTTSRDVQKQAISWRWSLMTVAAFIIAGWTFNFIVSQPPGMDGYVEIRARILRNSLGFAHVAGGGIAMALGPFQFLRRLRAPPSSSASKTPPRSRNSTHTWLGRIYATAVIASGIGSIDIVRNSELLPFGRVGFTVLGAAWVVTAVLGWTALWGAATAPEDVQKHRRWMTRNFALTYAAVMLRWQFPLMIVSGVDVVLALSIAGWSSWVPSLVFVEGWVLRKGS